MPPRMRKHKPSRRAGPVCPITCPLCGEKIWIQQMDTKFDLPTEHRLSCAKKCPGSIRLIGTLADTAGDVLVVRGGTLHRRPRPGAVPA